MKYMIMLLLCCFLFAGCSSTTIVTFETKSITENPIGTKVGQVSRFDGGTREAAKNGSITRISTVSLQNTDKYTTNYWPLLLFWAGMGPTTTVERVKEEIIVTGE